MKENNSALNTDQELDIQIEQMIEKTEGIWQCKLCGKTIVKRGDMQKHAETHIQGVYHVCHICNKTFSTRASLRDHISNIHSELFSCDLCEKSGMNRRVYTHHKRNTHASLNK
jgi:ribosomal protein L37AE/L43A